MAINFPDSPTLNEEFTSGNTVWTWNGAAWIVKAPDVFEFQEADIEVLSVSESATIQDLSINGALTGVDLNNLSDVNITNVADQDVLQYNSSISAWEAGTVAAVGGFNGGSITNPLFINNATESVDPSSGALRISGGAGIGSHLFVGGSIGIESGSLLVRSRSTIKMFNEDNSQFVELRAPTSSSDITYTLPGTDGASGQFLRTNGTGTLSWASAVSASGGTPPGGLTSHVQFNNNNDFDGNVNFTFDAENLILSAPNIVTSGTIDINDLTSSTSSTTGALTVAGGVGIEENLNVDGVNNSFTGGTASNSINTGTIVVTGGIGVSENINAGGNISADPAPIEAEHLTNKRYVDANVLAFSVAFGA